MELEQATNAPDAYVPAISVRTTAAPIAAGLPSASDGDAGSNQRWLAWRGRGAEIDRRTAAVMNGAFATIAVAVSVWLILEVRA